MAGFYDSMYSAQNTNFAEGNILISSLTGINAAPFGRGGDVIIAGCFAYAVRLCIRLLEGLRIAKLSGNFRYG